jgi:hypothetical protein
MSEQSLFSFETLHVPGAEYSDRNLLRVLTIHNSHEPTVHILVLICTCELGTVLYDAKKKESGWFMIQM